MTSKTLCKIMDLLADVLDQFAASDQEVQATSDDSVQLICTLLPRLLVLVDKSVDAHPLTRKVVATGIAPFIHSQFALDRKTVMSAVFTGSFKRCALLWKLLLKELEASSCPQRLLLKLEYCQGFCIRAFNSSPVDTKRLLVLENAASITFGLDLSIAVLQGSWCIANYIDRKLATYKATISYRERNCNLCRKLKVELEK